MWRSDYFAGKRSFLSVLCVISQSMVYRRQRGVGVGLWVKVENQDCLLESLQCGVILGQEDLFGKLGNFSFVMQWVV